LSEAVANGVLHEFRGGLHADLFHDAVFVKGHGSRSYAEDVRNFLHQSPFGEQLQDFALPGAQLVALRIGVAVEEYAQGYALGEQRGDVAPAIRLQPKGGKRFRCGGAFQQEARSAKAKRFGSQVRILRAVERAAARLREGAGR